MLLIMSTELQDIPQRRKQPRDTWAMRLVMLRHDLLLEIERDQ